MIIHVVQAGETAADIAKKYGISEEILIRNNEIQNPNNLATGETLVILIPSVTHTVQEGDTLLQIAEQYGVSLLQLLRNNPFLSERENIYPGEALVISYSTEKKGRLSIFGYAYPHIRTDVLKKTLPFLTYITVYSYSFTDDGKINNIDDSRIVELARQYQVAPIMMLNVEDNNQNNAINNMHKILINQESQEQLFYNVNELLREKGYYGVNLNVPYIYPYDRSNFVDFMIRFSNSLKKEGHAVIFYTLSLSTFEIMTGIVYEGFNYSKLSQSVDGLLLMTYEWGNNIGIPTGIISFHRIQQYVLGITEKFPAEKIYMGIPILGYLWELPFILGESKGYAITSNTAVELSKDMGAAIHYDDISKTAYFQYINGREYVVRFRDTRSINEFVNMVAEFGLAGISIWNIMKFYPQLWLVVNALYDIINIYEIDNSSREAEPTI